MPKDDTGRQEAQLSQRDRATLLVVDYFAKSLNVTQGHSKIETTLLSRTCVSRY